MNRIDVRNEVAKHQGLKGGIYKYQITNTLFKVDMVSYTNRKLGDHYYVIVFVKNHEGEAHHFGVDLDDFKKDFQQVV